MTARIFLNDTIGGALAALHRLVAEECKRHPGLTEHAATMALLDRPGVCDLLWLNNLDVLAHDLREPLPEACEILRRINPAWIEETVDRALAAEPKFKPRRTNHAALVVKTRARRARSVMTAAERCLETMS